MLSSMTTATDLLALQDIDLELDSLKMRLAEIEGALGETEELIEARAVVEEKEQRLKELRSRQSDQEMSVEDVRGKARKVDERLYSGTVTNPKELGDLHSDYKMLNRQASELEDELLATLMETESAETELDEAQSAYADIHARWQEEQDRLKAEKAEIEPEVARLEEERKEEVSGIDPRALRLYDLLRERRGDAVVARVERGMCGGCRITLPSAVLTKAKSGSELVQCVSCERILLVN